MLWLRPRPWLLPAADTCRRREQCAKGTAAETSAINAALPTDRVGRPLPPGVGSAAFAAEV
jgi:hypothetical protein